MIYPNSERQTYTNCQGFGRVKVEWHNGYDNCGKCGGLGYRAQTESDRQRQRQLQNCPLHTIPMRDLQW